MNLKQVNLAKNIKLRNMPFSGLAVPWNITFDSTKKGKEEHSATETYVYNNGKTSTVSLGASKNLKRYELETLKHSIGRFGLLKPFHIARIPKRLVFFYGEKKYFIIDGCKRYFAIKELLKLPTGQEEQIRKENLRTYSGHYTIDRAEIQAQEKFSNLNIQDYVMIPCLIYPYDTDLQLLRHRMEDKRLSVKPSREDLNLAAKLHQEGVEDLKLEDLSQLWDTRLKIEEEKSAIEKTLKQIRERFNHLTQQSSLLG